MKQLAMESAENRSFSMLFSCYKNCKVNEVTQLKRTYSLALLEIQLPQVRHGEHDARYSEHFLWTHIAGNSRFVQWRLTLWFCRCQGLWAQMSSHA